MKPAQGSPEWLAQRIGKITSSVAAGCLGKHPWMSRQKAWRAITGNQTESEKKPNNAMQFGTEMERHARTCYEATTGRLVMPAPFVLHPTQDWLGASPDGYADEGLAEFKCPGVLPESVPEHYLIQMRVQMACTNRPWVDFFAWTRDDRFFLARVERDTSAEKDLIDELWRFHQDYVLTNTEPPRKGAA